MQVATGDFYDGRACYSSRTGLLAASLGFLSCSVCASSSAASVARAFTTLLVLGPAGWQNLRARLVLFSSACPAAACNEYSVILGGWFLHKGPGCASAPWFQLKLGREETPWLFGEGLGSSWASTSAELLGSLVALHLLERDFAGVLSGPGSFRACFSAGTDNKAADSISARLLTTKVPVMFVLMEFSYRCDTSGIRCLLNWRPRDANQEADRITKNDFSDFSADLRVAVSWDELRFSVLPSLLRYANFQSTLNDRRADTAGEATAPPRIRFEKSRWG